MPIVVNGGVISYTTPEHQRLAEQTFSYADIDWSIHDKDNVLKQIKFEIVPTSDTPGVLTIQCNIGSDQTVTLSDIVNTNAFGIIQPDTGTSPTATSPTDTLIITAGDTFVEVDGNAGLKTITLSLNTLNLAAEFTRTIQSISSATTIATQVPDLSTYVDTSGAAFTITLPAASTVRDGWRVSFKDVTGSFRTNNLTVAPNGSDEIENVNASRVFRGNYQSITLESDGTSNWWMQ